VQESVLDEIEKVRIGLWLFQTFLQQLDHEQSHGIFLHIEEKMPVENSPTEFTDPLQILQLIVVDDQVEDGRGLKEIGLSRPLAG
jgi:hypothetical protein